MKNFLKEHWFPTLVLLVVLLVVANEFFKIAKVEEPAATTVATIKTTPGYWVAPNLMLDKSLNDEQRKLVEYGQSLIANTSLYLGPTGSVNHTTNGMNCQNCHLDAGARPWGNNYSAVASTYPKFRERSGKVENIPKRVNDCIERSLNGTALPIDSHEMKAIVAYMEWLGKEVPKGEKPTGVGISDVTYLERAADPLKGKIVFDAKCQSCHGADGKGMANLQGAGYTYPPLWGEHSYNTGAGLYRLSRFAGYVKENMPYNQASHSNPLLTDEEAWDIAAFVNSQPRPIANISADWPKISAKPLDHPYGPYHDGFSETQHKYGPFKPIVEKRKQLKALEANKNVAINK